jgi:hypothetical protein
MSLWASLLLSLLLLGGLVALLLALVHVRYEAAWFGLWDGGLSLPHESNLRLEFGFPGFMHAFTWGDAQPDPEPKAAESGSPPAEDSNPMRQQGEYGGGVSGQPGTGKARPTSDPMVPPAHAEAAPEPAPSEATAGSPPPKKDPHRYRKALFRIFTDGQAWALLIGYGVRMLKRAYRLLGLRIELAAGHPDPALLGRFAGVWYAVSPLIAPRGTTMAFRFQDRQPAFGARVKGGFSLLSLFWFLIGSLFAFPLFRLAARALHGWRHRQLAGWRAFTYRKIQAL